MAVADDHKAETITIDFGSGVLAGTTSGNITVSPAAANKLTIVTQPPVTATAGVTFAPQPQIRIEDQFGNLRSTDNSSVITAARGAGTGTLQGNLNVTATGGVATFTNLSHNVATNITIVFASGSLSSATGNDNDRISFVYRTSDTTTMAIPIIVTLGKAPTTRLLSMGLTSYGAPLATVMRKAFSPVRPIVRMVGVITTRTLERSRTQPMVTTATTLISTSISTTSVRVSNADMRMVITAAISTVHIRMAAIASLARS